MKAAYPHRWRVAAREGFRMALVPFLLISGLDCSAEAFADGKAVITAAYASEGGLVVVAEVPEGTKQATLEFRARRGTGTWLPLAVHHLDGTVTTVTFRHPIPEGEEIGLLRVRAASGEALPASFYTGDTLHEGSRDSGCGLVYDGAVPGSREDGSNAEDREVVESDVWKLADDTLYFFNQMRGLQVLDVSNPDAPSMTATLSAPAAGEEMYLFGDHVLLLLRGGRCAWWAVESETVVGIVDMSGGNAAMVARVAVEGWYQDSRLVGSILYVATSAYRPTELAPDGSDPATGEPGQTVWEYGTLLSAVDLADPAHPVAGDTLWFPGWGNVVSATPDYFFVCVTDPGTWRRMHIHVVDISDPFGAMQEAAAIPVAGIVADKFKIHLDETALTVISEARDGTGGPTTVLETFDLGGSGGPARLGTLRLAEGERLHATRFDDDRVYVVTFEQIDPLWIVDLGDPAHPAVVGELEVPGWSTYIEPLGDRLVTVGIDNEDGWRVAVCLFDVGDPAAPELMDKVTVGEEWSWSEATVDERAFGVLEEAGLILLPFQSGEGNRVQLIDLDLGHGRLEKRGMIEHEMRARRSTRHRERILSVSGRELVTVDAADRDDPVVTSRLELAWGVDRTFLAGGFVIEVEDNAWVWGAEFAPVLRVADAADPETVASVVDLKGPPILGAVVRDERFYVVQSDPEAPWIEVDGTWIQQDVSLALTIWDLGDLPNLRLLGRAESVVEPLGWGTGLEPLFPSPHVLVLAGVAGASSWGWWWYDAMLPEGDSIGRPWYWGGGGGRLLAFDVSDPGDPVHLSTVDLRDGEDWNWAAGVNAFVESGLIFMSHWEHVLVEHPLPDDPPDPGSPESWSEWLSFWYLDVIDYADPVHPTVRPAAALPGELVGLGRSGNLLYVRENRWAETGEWLGECITACAYDGVEAHRIDRLPLPEAWPRPFLVSEDAVVLGRPSAEADVTPPALEVWVLPDAARFIRRQTLALGSAAEELGALGDVVAARTVDRRVVLTGWDSSGLLEALGGGELPGCAWYKLVNGDGDRARGAWIPLGSYGVGVVPVAEP